MKINTHELRNQSEMEIEGIQSIVLHGLQAPRTKTKCDVKIKGKLIKSGKSYILEGTGQTNVPLACDRCLETFNENIHIKFHQKYTTKCGSKDEEAIFLTTDEIDLEDIITEAVSLKIPMKRLHDENCKGICAVCGANLNEKSCDCDVTEIDPRLVGLKDLFTQKN